MSCRNGSAGPMPPLRPWDGHKYRSALFACRRTLAEVAEAAGVSRSHLTRVIHGQRPALPDLLFAMALAVGPDGWKYATGESDRLPMEGVK